MQDHQALPSAIQKPLVSFIIAYYNLPLRMLCECIDSILALSLQPAERQIIVVDDGSDASPANDLAHYGEALVYIRQQHQGLSEARNTGIQMASGSYLQFTDGDDLFLQAPYEHCLDLIRTSHPEMVVFAHTDKTPATIWHDQAIQSGSHYLRHHNLHGTACGYLFSRSILGNLRFTPGIWHEDEEFTPQLLLRAETVCVTDAQAYLYRQRPGSITTDGHLRQRLQRLEDTRGIVQRLSLVADRLPPEERTALQRRVAQLTMDYLYNIIRQTGSRHYLERKMEALRREGLFPLPCNDYTTRYTWFRRLSNSPAGITLLMRLIPLIPKER